MASQRQQKVAKQLQKDLGELFQFEFRELFGSAFVTITDAEISPDLGVVDVYLSVLGKTGRDQVMENVELHNSRIRGALGKRIRHQFRIVPELRFHLDETADRAQHIDQILGKLDIPDEDSGAQEDEDIYNR